MTDPIVLVEWEDSSGTGGDTWQTRDEVAKAVADENGTSCWSAGYLILKDDRCVTLTLSHNGNHGMVMDPLIIPRSAIRSIQTLGPVDGREVPEM